MSTIVISRFLLDIRAAAYRTEPTMEPTTNDFSLSSSFGTGTSGQGMWHTINFDVKSDGTWPPRPVSHVPIPL